MFWKRSNDVTSKKLPGPRDIPDLVKKSPALATRVDSGTIPFLKAVVKPTEKTEKAYDIRIFDPQEAEAIHLAVKDYDSLNGREQLIIAQGRYSDSDRQAEIEVTKTIPPPKLLTYDQVLAQIEELKEPGSSVFFFMSAGPGAGGPLGRGASVIKLNAPTTTEGKKQKRYSVYGANVVDMQPSEVNLKIYDSDKAKEVAKWIAESQKPRFC